MTHDEHTAELKAQLNSESDRKILIFDEEGNRMEFTDVSYDGGKDVIVLEVMLAD